MRGIQGWFFGLIFWCVGGAANAGEVTIGERLELDSELLGETRSYQVYLPPAYTAHPGARYPVLYMLDGDYNFHYVTGLVDQLSTLSQRIPPMIVVGVSDRGSDSYRAYMTEIPARGGMPEFARYLIKELKPAIEKKYRAAPRSMLAGHSIGGLFVLLTLLAEPEAFSTWIAISPALWGEDYAFLDRADARLKSGQALPARLYVSLADEKEMGVYSLVGSLERFAVPELRWDFRHFPDENHDSVGLPGIKHALLQDFDGYELDRERLDALDTDPEKVIGAYREYAARLGHEPLLPNTFGRIITFYAGRDRYEDIEKLVAMTEQHFPLSYPEIASQAAVAGYRAGRAEQARTSLLALADSHPDSVTVLEALGTVHAGNPEKVNRYAVRALELAREQDLPRWRLNQLEAAVQAGE